MTRFTLIVLLFAGTAAAQDCPDLAPAIAGDCRDGSCPVVRTATAPIRVVVRTADNLTAAIRAARTNRVYATMARGQSHLVKIHLVQQHGYTSAQVAPLTQADALMLHNLAHGPRINALIGGRAPGVRLQITKTTSSGNCANGQCARTTTATVQRRGLFGRLFGR